MRVSLMSLSMSQIVAPTDFGLDSSQTNKCSYLNEFKDTDKDIILTNANLELFKIRGKNRIIGAIDSRQSIVYYVQYEDGYSSLLGKYVQQIMLWSNRSVPSTTNVSKRVFFEYLIEKYGTMLADTYQTPSGATFWASRCIDALGLGLNVYAVNFHTRQVTPISVGNLDEMFKLTTGVGIGNKATRLCISKHALN